MALKVIGAGLARTGTLSLKCAPEHLGFGPCCHAIDLISSLRQQLPNWLTVFGGSPDWDQVYQGFVPAVGYPTCRYSRELASFYFDAKVILSTRDAQGSFDSMNRTVLSAESIEKIKNNPVSALVRGLQSDLGQSPIAAAFKGDEPGSSEAQPSDRQAIIDYFERREAEIVESLPPERLLVHRPGDGWGPLCAFLGVPVQAEPFPRINTSEGMMVNGLVGETQVPSRQLRPLHAITWIKCSRGRSPIDRRPSRCEGGIDCSHFDRYPLQQLRPLIRRN